MIPRQSDVGTALCELAQAAQAAEKSAEQFVRELCGADIQGWISGKLAGPAGHLAQGIAGQVQRVGGHVAGGVGQFLGRNAGEIAGRAGGVAGPGLQVAGHVFGAAGQFVGDVARQGMQRAGPAAGRVAARGEAGCEYLISIADGMLRGDHAQSEVLLAHLLRALKTWTTTTAASAMALLIRLSGVAGRGLREFVFRLSRAAMHAFGLAARKLPAVLQQVVSWVANVGSIVVAVVLALYAVATQSLGTVAMKIEAVLACVLTNTITALATVDLLGIGMRLQEVLEKVKLETSQVTAELVVAVISSLLAAGAAITSVATHLRTVPAVVPATPRPPVPVPYPVLQGSLLAQGWAAVRDQCAVGLGGVVMALKTELSLTLAQAGQSLFAAGIAADDIVDALGNTWGATKSQIAVVLKDAGKACGEIATALKSRLNAGSNDVASAPAEAGYGAADVAAALKDKLSENLVGAARAMKHAGWGMDAIADALASAWSMARSAVQTALRAAGL